jgi:crotonobetainyl-CoA:carnitine CoA-transferase CaiB-like acyl-CoA transferase
MQPLQGITVVALEHAIAAPFATRQLADLGARVIKIERPGVGDFARGYDQRVRGLSSHFVWTNRSKESLTLDLKQPAAAALLQRLVIEKADVLVQNLGPGAAARLGLSHARLSPLKSSLIVCDISGYGDDGERPGPYRDKKAYDLLIQSEAGLVSVTGAADAPAKAGLPVADIAAGMYAYSNVLAALMQRTRDGRGRRIDVSMLEALGEWMGFPMYYAFDGADGPPRSGAAHPTISPYGPYPVGDGGSVMLGAQNEREWRRFCEQVLERPALVDDPRFADNGLRNQQRGVLHDLIAAAFADLGTDEVVRRLDRARIANAQVNDMQGLWAHAQLRARDRWTQVDSPAGALPALWPPGQRAGEARMHPVPHVGQHTDSILAELGLSASDIAMLRAAGAV